MKIKKSIVLVLSAILFSGSSFSQNVVISTQNHPNEPSIMMNPDNTDILVAASNLNNYFLSNDGGHTWTTHTLSSPYGVWGDPVIDVDTSGNFYFFHLSNTPGGTWIDRIVCQKSEDNGNHWNDGSYTGLNGTKNQDKQWSVIDRNNNNIYLTWTQFDDYGSSSMYHRSNILFSKSTDQGETWSEPVRISSTSGDCVDSDNTTEGAVPAVGPNGEIYVAWAGPNGLVFNRSLDQGETWLDREISIGPMPGGWDYRIPGINRSNGMPITKCDLSGGPNHGTIYVNWSDQRNGVVNVDIWLSESTDGGDTWSEPVRVNDDNTQRHQFFTWMDIDQTNGNLYFVFYDRRNYSDLRTDVYLAISNDGGNTFINKIISESPFVPSSGVFFGDYTNIVAHNDIVRPIWTRLHGGALSILTDVTPLGVLLSREEVIHHEDHQLSQYPNPASDRSFISFKLHEMSSISLSIIDQNGKTIKTLINDRQYNYGKHVVEINRTELGLMKGIYYCRLSINGQVETTKMVLTD